MLSKLSPLLGPCVLTFVIRMENIHETCFRGLACFLLNSLALDLPCTLTLGCIQYRRSIPYAKRLSPQGFRLQIFSNFEKFLQDCI